MKFYWTELMIDVLNKLVRPGPPTPPAIVPRILYVSLLIEAKHRENVWISFDRLQMYIGGYPVDCYDS